MSAEKNYRTIKDARAELREWGRFWQRYEASGYCCSTLYLFMKSQERKDPKQKGLKRLVAGKGETELERKRLEDKSPDLASACVGVDIPIDARTSSKRVAGQAPETSEEVFVPWQLQKLDDFIESLQPECRNALRSKYIGCLPEDGYWLNTAERLVMLR